MLQEQYLGPNSGPFPGQLFALGGDRLRVFPKNNGSSPGKPTLQSKDRKKRKKKKKFSGLTGKIGVLKWGKPISLP